VLERVRQLMVRSTSFTFQAAALFLRDSALPVIALGPGADGALAPVSRRRRPRLGCESDSSGDEGDGSTSASNRASSRGSSGGSAGSRSGGSSSRDGSSGGGVEEGARPSGRDVNYPPPAEWLYIKLDKEGEWLRYAVRESFP
jgi:hypothetical protein